MENIVQVNNSSLFDSASYSQGGLPHLLQYLWDSYVTYLQEELNKRKNKNLPSITLQEAKKNAPATNFVQWASNHLKEHRVVENFFLDSNHGIKLSNNISLSICPGTEIQGTMQDNNSVPVTQGKSQKDLEGVVNTNSLRI